MTDYVVITDNGHYDRQRWWLMSCPFDDIARAKNEAEFICVTHNLPMGVIAVFKLESGTLPEWYKPGEWLKW